MPEEMLVMTLKNPATGFESFNFGYEGMGLFFGVYKGNYNLTIIGLNVSSNDYI